MDAKDTKKVTAMDARIRPKIFTQMHQVIENHPFFLPHDFSITSGEKDPTFTWRYVPRSAFFFSASVPSQKTISKEGYGEYYLFSGQFGPGEVNVHETYRATGLEAFLEIFDRWLVLVQEDLEAEPLKRELAYQQEQIEALLKDVAEIDDAYFSREEAEQLRSRLGELEKRMAAKIRASAGTTSKQVEDAEQRIAALEREFAALKVQISTHYKKDWWRSMLARCGKWANDPRSQHLFESGVGVAKFLLGAGSSDGG